MELIDILRGLMKGIRPELLGSVTKPGEPVKARVGPVPPEVDLVEVHTVPVNLSAVLDPATLGGTLNPTTRVRKNVQYRDQFPEENFASLGDRAEDTKRVLRDTPVVLPTGFSSMAGTPGVLEQFSGLVAQLNIPQLIGSIEGNVGVPVITKRAVSLNVDWQVLEKKADGTFAELRQGEHFIAPQGLSVAEPTFIFTPAIAVGDTAPELVRYLRATVRLSAGAARVKRTLPALEVKVPGLPLALRALLAITGVGGLVPEPGVEQGGAIGPELSDLKPITGAFDLVWDQAAKGVQGLRIPLQAEWRVTKDAEGKEVITDKEGFFRSGSLLGPVASLVFRPNVVEAVTGLPGIGDPSLDFAWLWATVRVAGQTEGVNLGPVRLPVPTLRLPTVLALFNHRSFSLATYGGIPPCVLVAIPANHDLGPSTAETVIGALASLRAALGRLAGPFPKLGAIGQIANMLGPVGRLVELLQTVHASATPGEEKGWKLIVRPTQEEGELENIVFYRELLFKEDAEDTFGSLMMIGPPGKRVRFFNAPGFVNNDEGAFDLVLPENENATIVAVIDSLHSDPPEALPASAVESVHSSKFHSFGDRISSFRFDPPL